MEEQIQKFKDVVIKNFSLESFLYRDWMVDYHLKVVERIALELCDIYSEADRDLVHTLVWFHDFGKPIDKKNEKAKTLELGPKALKECGFEDIFIEKVVSYWQLMEQKEEIDISKTPIEVQIISSADGASHFTGVFFPSYFGDGDDFKTMQENIRLKIKKDWERKIVLPEVKKYFQGRYALTQELLGKFPDKFLN